jgi:alanine racemase
MPRPLVARIDTAALGHNLAYAKRLAGTARVLAVVKANAYGHGLSRAARALRAADGFAVLTLDEAALLRTEGYTHPIVMLEGFFHSDELPEIARRRLQPVIHREDQADALVRARLEHRLDIYVKVDTGMHRLGLPPARLRDVLFKLRASANVGGITLMTHFARADDADVGVATQMAVFRAATAGLDLPISLANSAALLAYPESIGDWVRPGIMLYGSSPVAGQTGLQLGLLPVMSLHSQLIAVQNVRKGEGVGYGARFVAPRDMRVGVVACGYADGYPRHADTGTPVLVGGQRTRTLGRVSMDMLHVDLSDLGQAQVGSPVCLWGAALSVDEVAAAAGTISYELLTALAARVKVEET